MTVDRAQFAARLQWVRERLGLTKTEMAETIGITKSNYTQVEKGARMLTVDQIYALYAVHGVPMSYMLAGREADLPERLRR